MALLTVNEVAEFLKVSPKTIYMWAAADAIPSIKINGSLRFSPNAIKKWLKECQNESDYEL